MLDNREKLCGDGKGPKAIESGRSESEMIHTVEMVPHCFNQNPFHADQEAGSLPPGFRR